jgi:hypothetical protein
LCGKFIVLSEILMSNTGGLKKLRVFCVLGAATASLGMLPSAKGAPITFGSGQDITGANSDVDTTGTLVEAFDWDATTTVNGVTFTKSTASNNPGDGGSNGVTITTNNTTTAVLSGFDNGSGQFTGSSSAPYRAPSRRRTRIFSVGPCFPVAEMPLSLSAG